MPTISTSSFPEDGRHDGAGAALGLPAVDLGEHVAPGAGDAALPRRLGAGPPGRPGEPVVGVGGGEAHVAHPASPGVPREAAPGGVAPGVRAREAHEVLAPVVADADGDGEGGCLLPAASIL